MSYQWSNKQIREQVAVIDKKIAPTIVLQNATYLNSYLHRWEQANIWIYENRIVYIGQELPTQSSEIVDCTGQFLVPGYIEPHAHPFQVYNPATYAHYSAIHGTTTLINDNLSLLFEFPTTSALKIINELNNLPTSMYWWCRLDSQSEIEGTEAIFTTEKMLEWLSHPSILQAGELTAWPKLLNGDDEMLTTIQETKVLRKRIEGHFPGASVNTLTKLMLLGAEGDHEAMTGEEVLNRLRLGYMVTLRQSSIRPDLDHLLDGIIEANLSNYNKLMLTTDGSHAYFYENGMLESLIKQVMDKGISEIDAYHMASHNVAVYYGLENILGTIGVGRLANINFLEDKNNPKPISVLAKGNWIVKDGKEVKNYYHFDWHSFGYEPLQIEWNLQKEHLNVEKNIGLQLINNVIAVPYESDINVMNHIPMNSDESFLYMIDKNGKWIVPTYVKGFATNIGAFISTYSGTGDILLIGKNKKDMILAFNRMKELGGAIVLVENGTIIFELPLVLNGQMSDKWMEDLMQENINLNALMKKRGFMHDDILFTLLFFSATHLPFIRLTPKGVWEVKTEKVLVEPQILIN